MKRTKKTTAAAATATDAEARSTLTVLKLAERYLQHLEDVGKSRGTIFSYYVDLSLACRELGEKTPADALTEQDVAAFFECDAVTKTRTGKPKAPVTIEKTRRVLRMALTWAQREGLIAAAPVPATAANGAPDATAAKEARDVATDSAAEAKVGAPAPVEPTPRPEATKAKGRKRAPKPDADGAAEQVEC